MRVNVLVRQVDGSAYYRMILPARALKATGYDVEVIMPPKPEDRDNFEIRDADIVVINRPDNAGTIHMIEELKADGVKIIVDIDDLYNDISKNHSMYKMKDEIHAYALQSADLADVMIGSTPSIASRYRSSTGVSAVVNNYVPESYLSLTQTEMRDGAYLLGWSGTIGSHPNDLQVAGPAVKRALALHRHWRFAHLGPAEEGKQVCNALGITRTRSSGWLPFERYAPALAQLNVGIVPLENRRFNRRGKSWLKMAEFAACGVPVIASATDANQELYNAGVGEIAHNKDEWNRKLHNLIGSPDAMHEQIVKNREVMDYYTIENNLHQWIDAWEVAA